MLALFELENLFYKTYDQKVDKILLIVKLKWLYDEIKNENFSNEITSKFKYLIEKNLKKKILKLIEKFIDIVNSENNQLLIKNFKTFNFEFNNIIEHIGYNFKTSLVYQLTQFNYQSCGQYLNLKDNSSIQGDLLEYVFVNIISKQKNVKKLKIKKIQYLYQVIICYIKMFLKISFFILLFFSNFFLYLAVTFHIIFGFFLLNFLVICLIFFFIR